MKKFLRKVLALTTLASLIPVRVKKDEEKGKKSYQSLLFTVNVSPSEDSEGTDVAVNFDEGILTGAISGLVTARKEAELFADDEPEAAMLDAEELQVIADEAQEADDEAWVITDDAQEAAGEAQATSGQAQEAADETAEAAETVPDPEL